ncbi:MAG: alpha/beta hydrolase family protein [Kofleriaceae bacterium]
MKPFLVVALAACGSVDTPPPAVDGGVEPDAEIVVDADPGPQPTPACAADPTQCLYTPATYTMSTLLTDAYDPARVGGGRNINVAIRYSRTAPRPMPVVVWSHGGASGQTNALTALEEWSIAAARAGYVSVSIAHEPRTPEERQALCVELGFDQAGCDTFKFLSYDRPRDIAVVIDHLVNEWSNFPQLAAAVDLNKIAVGGHSAGAGGTLMVAGAPREINGAPMLVEDPRPVAFLAFSPQAPGSDGMTAEGYAQITRPTLIGTGRGDESPPDTADGRASVFDLVQPGDKARIFIEDPAAAHSVFALELAGCTNVAPLARCEELVSWVKSAGLAFLDAHLRGSPDAFAWLASSNLAVGTANVAEWSTR